MPSLRRLSCYKAITPGAVEVHEPAIARMLCAMAASTFFFLVIAKALGFSLTEKAEKLFRVVAFFAILFRGRIEKCCRTQERPLTFYQLKFRRL